ncbi:MAG TPA: hypothetical protein VFP72_21880 [Kineosporiaceae bacterium]|nr:hypothetical protein [Kineosporiaceae bacterium]
MSDMSWPLLANLFEEADQQWGLLTAEQASHHGCRDGVLTELLRLRILEKLPVTAGVYRVRAGGHHPFPRTYAGWLRLRPLLSASQRLTTSAGVVSHSTAAHVWGLGAVPGPQLEVTLTGSGTFDDLSEGTLLHQGRLLEHEWELRYGMPTTSPARTLADLTDSGRLDVDELAKLLTRVLTGGLGTATDLQPYAAARPLLQAALTDAQALTI